MILNFKSQVRGLYVVVIQNNLTALRSPGAESFSEMREVNQKQLIIASFAAFKKKINKVSP